ncbi:MAG TPA: amidase [Pyrinomonadaceae bacterium]|nr:amidase [Pyrinomonadaceae bacterium]
MSASALARLVRRREVSPVEVVAAHLRRVEELNPRLNAVVAVAPDATEAARRAEDALMRREPVGALHGVPVTVKDTIDAAGLTATAGSRLRSGRVPFSDAPSVARLRAAGAVILGKTNTSELALDYTADNPVHGRTLNPHSSAHTPGGSSGGCAAAVASCLTAASLGSDLTGSVRVPAHFCGVLGLRPTAARVPSGGHLPPAEGVFSLAASLGPLARSVEDLELLFEVLSGESDGARSSAASSDAGGLRGRRFAVYADDGVVPVSEETRAAVEGAARALEEAGLVAVRERPPGVGEGHGLWLALFSQVTRAFVRTTYAGREDEGGPVVRAMLGLDAKTKPPALEEFFGAWARRDELRAALVEYMKEVPLLVAPVGSTAAFEHGARKATVGGETFSLFRAFGYAQTFNVFDLPAACVPAGRTRDGLPVGVQLVGRPFGEATVLRAARLLEESLGGWQPPGGM